MDFYKKTKILGYEINSFVDTEEKNVWFLEKDILRLIDSIKNPSNKPPHRPIYTPPATSRGVSGGCNPPAKYYKHPVFDNYAVSKKGVVIHVKSGRKRKMSTNNCGYLFFSIYHKKLQKPKIYTLHRFVYEVFNGSIPKCFEIHHKNSIKTDNRIKNLELVTHRENIKKIYIH